MVSPLQWLSIKGAAATASKNGMSSPNNSIKFQAGVHVGHGDAHVLDALDGVVREGFVATKLRRLGTLGWGETGAALAAP